MHQKILCLQQKRKKARSVTRSICEALLQKWQQPHVDNNGCVRCTFLFLQPAFEATTTTAATAPTHEPTAASASLEEQEENVDFDDQRMVEVLQRLADDAELHKLLSDEKMRCEIHRSNYEKIKAEYLRYIITYHFSDPISFLSYDAFFPDPFDPLLDSFRCKRNDIQRLFYE